jgi:hypothetical protein
MDKIVMKQAVFELIDSLPALVSQALEPCPHQQRTGDVVALDTGFATLAILKPCQLLGFAVKLLNLPTHRTHLLSVLRRSLRQVVSHDPFRAVGRHLNSEQFHFVITRKSLHLDQYARCQLGLVPTECNNAPVRLLPTAIIHQAITLERTIEGLALADTHSGDLEHDLFGSVPGVHQHRLERQLAVLNHLQHLLYMIQFALAVSIRVKDAIVNHPELLAMRVDVHTRDQADTSDHTLFIAAPLPTHHLDVGSKAVVQHRIIENQIRSWIKCQCRLPAPQAHSNRGESFSPRK